MKTKTSRRNILKGLLAAPVALPLVKADDTAVVKITGSEDEVYQPDKYFRSHESGWLLAEDYIIVISKPVKGRVFAACILQSEITPDAPIAKSLYLMAKHTPNGSDIPKRYRWHTIGQSSYPETTVEVRFIEKDEMFILATSTVHWLYPTFDRNAEGLAFGLHIGVPGAKDFIYIRQG
ncbi:MAG: hypothetical protein ACYSUC_10885 [Planctomycetota bacterium]|jgi:hypothetical protein